MVRNYYKLAVRQLVRSRSYALLNIFGLATGIAFTLLIAAYCWKEWRVNRQLKDADRQCILTSEWKDPNMGYTIATLGPLAKELKDKYPSLVANYYRFDSRTSTISYGEKYFREDVAIGDSTLLDMYGFSLLHGDPHTALREPFSVVITEDMAMKYFGSTDVVGKNLAIDSANVKKDYRITGVMRTPERNSVTRLNRANDNKFFVPTANEAFFNRNRDWQNISIASYVELQKGVRPDALKIPIRQLIKTNTTADISNNLQVRAVPLESYYLNGGADGSVVMRTLYTLSFTAFFILLMAMVNFVNLSVSRSASRRKEIGVRKVLGGLRRQLIMQFLAESVILAFVATGLSIPLYKLVAPLLSGMLGNEIPSLSALPVAAWAILPVFAFVTGGLAGLYPALVLSAMTPIDSLKGRKGVLKENVLLRKGLLAFQFATATIVFVGAIIISQQIRLFFSDRLGYNKEYIVSAQVNRDWTAKGVQKMETIRNLFSGLAYVKEATLSYEIPNGFIGSILGCWRPGEDSIRAVISQAMSTDEYYADTYQIPMAAGVYFNKGATAEQNAAQVVINETEARALGWKDPGQAPGQHLRMAGVPGRLFTISGVIKDFHSGSMSSPIDPTIVVYVGFFQSYRYLSFKLRPGNIGLAISGLQKQWTALMPETPFEYRFMDETLQTLYLDELHLKTAASTATVLAIVIVLLGVIGMVSLSIQKRTKEIAIRKVVGAAVPAIIRLFLLEFLPLLLLAGVIASPAAWWLMQGWLEDYATRIPITPWPFVLAILSLGLVMALLIVGQTIRAALVNPVKSLQAEG